LKPKYNGSAKDLIPTLNLIHIHRQNEAWYSATILPLADGKTINLVQRFSQVATADMEKRAKTIWDSPTIETNRHTRGMPIPSPMTFSQRFSAGSHQLTVQMAPSCFILCVLTYTETTPLL